MIDPYQQRSQPFVPRTDMRPEDRLTIVEVGLHHLDETSRRHGHGLTSHSQSISRIKDRLATLDHSTKSVACIQHLKDRLTALETLSRERAMRRQMWLGILQYVIAAVAMGLTLSGRITADDAVKLLSLFRSGG